MVSLKRHRRRQKQQHEERQRHDGDRRPHGAERLAGGVGRRVGEEIVGAEEAAPRLEGEQEAQRDLHIARTAFALTFWAIPVSVLSYL
mgnify:CR=1 FL=1